MECKYCPIYDKELVSDANIKEACRLCGMGIENNMKSPSLYNDKGEKIIFCCERCINMYVRDIMK